MKSIIVENIKCGGCANSITKALNNLKDVDNININIETGQIQFSADQENTMQLVENILFKMGYPKQGDNTLVAKTKSYVSCMVGRMS